MSRIEKLLSTVRFCTFEGVRFAKYSKMANLQLEVFKNGEFTTQAQLFPQKMTTIELPIVFLQWWPVPNTPWHLSFQWISGQRSSSPSPGFRANSGGKYSRKTFQYIVIYKLFIFGLFHETSENYLRITRIISYSHTQTIRTIHQYIGYRWWNWWVNSITGLIMINYLLHRTITHNVYWPGHLMFVHS